MSRRWLIGSVVTVTVWSGAFTARAAVPGLMAYQGVLLDDSGQVVPDGAYPLTFRIFDAATGGAALWSSQDTVTVENGVFSALLGENNTIADAVFLSPDRWLETELTGQGPFLPRTRIATVAYTFRVGTIDGSTGGNVLGDVHVQSAGLAASLSSTQNATDPNATTVVTVGATGGGDPGQIDVTDGTGATISAMGGTGGLVAKGTFGSGPIPAAGAGARLMWYPGKSAVRGGRVSGTQWDDVNIGGESVAFGTDTRASGLHATIGGGSASSASAENATVSGGDANDIQVGGKGSTISGGEGNTISRPLGAIAGGMLNNVDGDTSSIAGGALNHNSGYSSAIGGGFGNVIGVSSGATIGGGHFGTASADWSTVSGGLSNQATNIAATVGGGSYDTSVGYCSVVPGGYGNRAAGDFASASGRRAKATYFGSFVWADGTDADFTSSGSNQFLIRASGGVGLGSGFNAPSAALDVDVSSILSRRAAEFRNNYASPGVQAATVTIENVNATGIALNASCNTSDAAVVMSNTNSSGAILKCFGIGSSVQFRVNGNGFTGIGTDSPSEKLQVVGDIRIGNSGTNGCIRRFDNVAIAGTCASDRRLKRDIRPMEPILERLARLQPVKFNWRVEEFPDRQLPRIEDQGLIAQDVEAILPELVTTDETGFRAVHYHQLPLLSLQAIKELKQENEELRAEMANLRRRFETLQQALEAEGGAPRLGVVTAAEDNE